MIDNNYLNKINSSKGDKKKTDILLAECKKMAKTDTSALVALSIMQLNGDLIEKNITASLKRLDSIVKESNDPEAAETMAVIYEKGLFGQQEDVIKAERFYRVAANAERSEAAYKLALYYEGHPQFTVDLSESFRWYDVASRGGHVVALEKLGAIFLTGGLGLFGDHIEKDEARGIELLVSATKKNSKDAAKRLALYHLGKLIEYTSISDESDKSISLIQSNMADIEWLSRT